MPASEVAMADPRHLAGRFTGGAIGGLHGLVGRYFDDERLQQAMSFQSRYLGRSSARLTAERIAADQAVR